MHSPQLYRWRPFDFVGWQAEAEAALAQLPPQVRRAMARGGAYVARQVAEEPRRYGTWPSPRTGR
ncbi:hypothetical protein [Streptomyces sp. JNUCC 63]